MTDPSTVQRPAELCGYSVVETLAEDATYLAIGPGGRGVVLKRLDPDCLYRELLHPDVRDRLSRIRELAHVGVANLVGVGKDPASGEPWLIWEYVEGKPMAEYATQHCRTPRELAVLVRELVLTLESLHLRGLVHGAIQSGNVIVGHEGAVRLTHISPLLYTDPQDDVDAIIEAVQSLCEERDSGSLPEFMTEARDMRMPLRGLAARLAVIAESRESTYEPATRIAQEERRTRKRAVFGAIVVALAGIALSYTIWRRIGHPGVESLPAWLK